jgi:hypothetical protein
VCAIGEREEYRSKTKYRSRDMQRRHGAVTDHIRNIESKSSFIRFNQGGRVVLGRIAFL